MYDNKNAPRYAYKTMAGNLHRQTDNRWAIDFTAANTGGSNGKINSGNYCVEAELAFNLNTDSRKTYPASTYLIYSDRESYGGQSGVFNYVSGSGLKAVTGLGFTELTGQRPVLCPKN
jgi:hypothetical protein